tara:strand:- start:78 stop:911 length:834 start_codon:yes stop_codon:yes gene_type:complete
MKIIENNPEFQVFVKEIRKKGGKIALIPTMGSIHEGHKSLIEKANKLGFFSAVTIFVNPTQFNDLKDYDNYPRNREQDICLLEKIDTNLLFFPSNKDLYPSGITSKKTILDYRNILCDKFRPGHFDGVTTVVKSLFNLINPDHVFLGEKDYQQLKLIQKMIKNDNSPILIHPCVSIRMKNGMSYSSRYDNFNSFQENLFKRSSRIIISNLNKLRIKIHSMHLDNIKKELNKLNIKKIEYIEVRNEVSLLPTVKNNHARLFIAYYIDEIRIIDNFVLY